MDVKSKFAVILLVFLTILSTIDCRQENEWERGKRPINRQRPRQRNSSPVKTKSPIHRAISGPILIENDLKKLQHLILFEADLIKVAAYNKLLKMYEEDANGNKIIPLIIKGATELVKFYGTGPMKNFIKLRRTFNEGMSFTNECIKVIGSSKIGTCYKLKAQLLEAYIFSSPTLVNRSMRRQLRNTINAAKERLEDDNTIAFLETKIACEMKWKLQNKKNYVKRVKNMFTGLSHRNIEENNIKCVDELLKFGEIIIEVGSYIGEYFYLLGRAYADDGNNSAALEMLNEARKEKIIDSKRRQTNKEVQRFVEKLYLFEKAY